MLLMSVVSITIVCAVVGGILRFAIPLIVGAAALRRQRMAMTAMLRTVPNPEVPKSSQFVPPNVVLPPIPPTTGSNIYMPGGPAVVGGQVFVPGMTPKWPR